MAQKEQIQRLMLVARKIKSKPYISISDLEREVEQEMVVRGYDPAISPNTLKRDIKKLRDDFCIGIEFCRTNHGYYIENEDLDMVDTIFEPLDTHYALSVDGGLPEYIITEHYSPKGTQHLQPIIAAIKSKKQVKFTYSKYSTSAISDRTISPYVLKQHQGRWYLIGRESSTGMNKTFGLDRIELLEVLPITAELDSDLDITQQFKYSYGIYSDKNYPIEDIVLSFDAEDGGYLKSVPLHPSQEILADTEDEFRIKLRLRITLDFVKEIVSRSWSVRVITPDSLREKICTIYSEALERNRY